VTTILLVEDDLRIGAELSNALQIAGFGVDLARDLASARQPREHGADLILLDLGLPDGDGLDLCRELRANGSEIPILMLTARDAPQARVEGLEAGADDYVIKPFHLPELLARVRGLLRRAGVPLVQERHALGELWADSKLRVAGDQRGQFELRRREFDLLLFLMCHPGRPWTRGQLLRRVWGADFDGTERTVDIHVRRLRQQIEADPNAPTRLLTDFGVGYRMEESD